MPWKNLCIAVYQRIVVKVSEDLIDLHGMMSKSVNDLNRKQKLQLLQKLSSSFISRRL